MKKLLPHILILIALALIFVSSARAEDPLGTCTVTTSKGGVTLWPNITEKGCRANTLPENTKVGDVTFVDWAPNPKCQAPKVLKDGACVDPTPNPTAPPTTTPPTATKLTDYTLLAPLPCDPDTNSACDPTTKTLKIFDPTFQDGKDSKLGQYLNIILRLLIGLCAVFAVIMIVIGGIRYMTSELLSGKKDGLEKIQNAIFGLLLALGAYILLFTINPALLSVDLSSVTQQTVTVELVSLPDGSYSSSGGAGAGSSGGSCAIVTDPNNACSTTKLKASCFGSRAEEASKICRVESGGGRTSVESGSDRLNNGTGPAYSVGLWQINLTVHKIKDSNGIVLNCPAAFSGTCGKGTATSSKNGPFVGGPKVGNCSVTIKDQNLYNACVTAAKDPVKNTEVACRLYQSNGFKPWAYTANKCSVPY